ncbi:type II toxin-antitoxin system prevent-host-death family antitoxin [Streptomyces radicis]|uniref:Type II toxin-antitoxin system prevent-host-death family antitoxin n=1 Tax=Streptomyces radicis TaxID=1750517 RepID=A0A3A9W1M6_9ACTN|nr:type II toxin-antitoxin system prevent-host-death family antitoxin [Streptomyces radicis]RKN03104.1 type II toxin-antitoxin system prevent-host-death family antitoxin [Streptomyces radicis]RKN13029.1 type II toxin-antitoxin system prevent-host-death family antitoxin [Streptomyces radicis]
MVGGVDDTNEALGVEAARARWSEIIASATHGTVTHLRDAESGAVARLVPREQSLFPVEELPAWAVTAARPKLGDLVRQAAAGQPVALTRRGDLAAVLAPVPGASTNPATGGGLDELLDTLTAATPQAPASLVPTGLDSLDTLLGGGLRPGQLALVTGSPGSGTSALALGAARAAALTEGLGPVMVASAQMSRQDLAARMLAAEANLPLAQITTQTVPETDRPRLEAAAARLRGAPLHLMDRQTTLTQTRTAAAAVPDLALLVLDPVTHFDVGTAAPALALRRLATDLRAAVLAVAAHGPGLLPVEAEADIAARLHRQDHSATAQLEIVRYRHGPTTTLPLNADLARARLLPATPTPVDDEPPIPSPPPTSTEPAPHPVTDSPQPPTTTTHTESPTAHQARAGHQRHQAARRTKSADQAAQALREMITDAVENELATAQGDAEAAMERLSKRAIPDVMRLFDQTRKSARYEYTAYPALPDILHKPSKKDPDLIWEARPSWANPAYRRHPDGELRVTALDVNAAYLSALKCHLPIGRLEHNPNGDYDSKRAGIHLITPPVWHHRDLPNPLGDREEPGPLWITTATLRLLLRLAGPKHQLLEAPVIHESWTSSATENFLDAMRQVLAAVRTDAIDEDDYVTLHYIKMMYAKLVSTMGESTENRAITRPDWMHNIRSQAFANIYGRALKAHQAGLTVISVMGTDELHVAGDVWAARSNGKAVFTEGRGLADMKVKTDRDGAPVHYTVTRSS